MGLLGGVLPAVYSGADQIKRRVKGLLGDPRKFLAEVGQDYETVRDEDAALAYTRGLLSPRDPAYAKVERNEPAFTQRQAAEAERRMLDIAMQGLTVWHGSPHKFDKFDSAHIGKGEGAQAYGHGLYLAESPDVARQYADNLATYNTTIGGKELTPDHPHFSAAMQIAAQGYEKALKRAEDALKSGFVDKAYGAAEVAAIKALKGAKIKQTPNSNLYKVDLPDSAVERMLDWDKPLSQQPESVRRALAGKVSENEPLGSALKRAHGNPMFAGDLLGKDKATADELVRGLAARGIPGIRYLDGGSRGAGAGTRNFVVFPGEEGLLTILERNGRGLLGQ